MGLITFTPIAILTLILVLLTLFIEFPLCKTLCPVSPVCGRIADVFKNNIMRAVWYVISGILFFVAGGYGSFLFYISGIFSVLGGIFYAIAELRGQRAGDSSQGAGIV